MFYKSCLMYRYIYLIIIWWHKFIHSIPLLAWCITEGTFLFRWIWNMILNHIIVLLLFSSKTETGFRNMRNIDDPCFKSKHEPEPVRKWFCLPQVYKMVSNVARVSLKCWLPILHNCYIYLHLHVFEYQWCHAESYRTV